jgi:hypothetical protein
MGIPIRNHFDPGSGMEKFGSEIRGQHPRSATLDKMNKNYFKYKLILIRKTTKTLLYILGYSKRQSSTALIIYRTWIWISTFKVHNQCRHLPDSHRYHSIQIYSYVGPRKHSTCTSTSVKEKANN